MAQITWRNINAPSFAEAAALYQSAGQQIGGAFQGLSGALDNFKQQQVDQDNRAYLAGALQAQNPDQLAEYLAGQGAALAGRGNVTTDAMLQASGLADTLSSRRIKDLEYSEAQKAIDTRGDLGSYLMATLTGDTVDPAVAAQAMTNPLFAQAAPSALLGRMGYDQKDAHFNQSIALQRQQLAQQSAYNNARLAQGNQANNAKAVEQALSQAVGAIVADANKSQIEKVKEIQALQQQIPNYAMEIGKLGSQAISDSEKLLEVSGVKAAAAETLAKVDTPINVGDILQRPAAVSKHFKGIPGLEDKDAFSDLSKVVSSMVKSGAIAPTDDISLHELTRLIEGGIERPGFLGMGIGNKLAFDRVMESLLPFVDPGSAASSSNHPAHKWQRAVQDALIRK